MADAQRAKARHLVAVWNPWYASNAMEAHLAVLLGLARRYDTNELGDDELYVWWGKVRSPNRQQPLKHEQDIAQLASALDESDETHLYLTDYQSLYVGDISAVVTHDVSVQDEAHVPAYYRAERLTCDFWFKLRDIRALVVGDMAGVTAELRKLRNTHYHDRPVSLYGGMVDLPLIVTRDDDRRFFDEDERERCTDGMLWAEWDAEHAGGVGEMERELRENLFGDVAWSALDPAARRFIATAERAFRDHRADSGFDFAHCLAGYGKAIEVQTNLILKAASARLEPKARLVKTEMRTVDLATSEALPLGQLARAIGGERELNAGLRAVLDHGAWFTGQFPVILDDFVTTARNPGTHATRIDRETATRWRSRMVGVGCEGVLVELAKVKPLRRG